MNRLMIAQVEMIQLTTWLQRMELSVASAETQAQVSSTGCYDLNDFLIDISGFSCVEPSSGNEVFPSNPMTGEPVIWLNFDVRPNSEHSRFKSTTTQVTKSHGALYYEGSPTSSVAENSNGEYLSGDCSDLTLTACGVESSNTWNTLPVPNFSEVSNYYLVIWDQQNDGNVQVNNFKARYGCGDASVILCNIDLDGFST